jgi:hypothetical protein
MNNLLLNVNQYIFLYLFKFQKFFLDKRKLKYKIQLFINERNLEIDNYNYDDIIEYY